MCIRDRSESVDRGSRLLLSLRYALFGGFPRFDAGVGALSGGVATAPVVELRPVPAVAAPMAVQVADSALRFRHLVMALQNGGTDVIDRRLLRPEELRLDPLIEDLPHGVL